MPGMGGLKPRFDHVYKQFMVRASVIAHTKEERTRDPLFFRRAERFDKITFKPDRDMIEAVRKSFGGIYTSGWFGTVMQYVFPETYTLTFPEAEGTPAEFTIGTDVIITFGYKGGRDGHVAHDQVIRIEKIEMISSGTAFR